MFPYLKGKIADTALVRHCFCAIAIILVMACDRSAQIKLAAPTNTDIQEIIDYYKTNDPAKSVIALQSHMPPPAIDKTFRASIQRQLPTTVTSLQIENLALRQAALVVLDPVLSLYGRNRVYDLIIVDAPAPMMMSDSGVALVVTTGMLRSATSDDELLGYVAHEIGHEYFRDYSIYSRHLIQLINDEGKEPVLTRRMAENMAIIELQCDAFAGLTLTDLGYQPSAFISGIERTAHDFPNYSTGFHPPAAERRKVVEGILPAAALSIKPRQSKAFLRLKELLAERQQAAQK